MEESPLGVAALCVSQTPMDQDNLSLSPPHFHLPIPY